MHTVMHERQLSRKRITFPKQKTKAVSFRISILKSPLFSGQSSLNRTRILIQRQLTSAMMTVGCSNSYSIATKVMNASTKQMCRVTFLLLVQSL